MKLSRETIKQADEILARGMCSGLGEAGGQMCIEAAASVLAGEPFGSFPTCVNPAVRAYSIRVNDAGWSSADPHGSSRLGHDHERLCPPGDPDGQFRCREGDIFSIERWVI